MAGQQTIRRVTGERVATVTDLASWRDATRLEDLDGIAYDGLMCNGCGSTWWDAAVMLEVTGLIAAYTAITCRGCGAPIGEGGN